MHAQLEVATHNVSTLQDQLEAKLEKKKKENRDLKEEVEDLETSHALVRPASFSASNHFAALLGQR